MYIIQTNPALWVRCFFERAFINIVAFKFSVNSRVAFNRTNAVFVVRLTRVKHVGKVAA